MSYYTYVNYNDLTERRVIKMNKLKKYRELRKITQAELAKAIGVKRTTITMIESGVNRPSLKTAFKLSKYFGIPVEELFDSQFKDNISKKKSVGV